MTQYLDTSVVVAAITQEVHTEVVRQWLEARPVGTAAISAWVGTEVSSALSIKVRTGLLLPAQRSEATAGWRSLRTRAIAMLPIAAEDFERAASFAERHELSLRGGDALHVAIAFAHGCTLITLDRAMAAAAVACGVPVEEIV